MKNTNVKKVLLLLCWLFIGHIQAANLGYNERQIDSMLSVTYRPYPVYGDPAWSGIDAGVKKEFIRNADNYLNQPWISLPAQMFMEFRTIGDRVRYEAIYFNKRSQLLNLVMGELLENKGRYIPDIVNGIWSICEESWWGIPAHYEKQLPDMSLSQTVDLFSAETASMMSSIQYLFRDKLDQISPLLNKRISEEVDRRMIKPALEESYWWMTAPMNWNPWICSNWMTSLLLSDVSREIKVKSLAKILQSVDLFYQSYPSDGGCDEGPAYWGRAAASLFDCLNILSVATDKKIDLSQDTKFREMGRFVCKTYISDNRYVNFADAPSQITPDVASVYLYGTYVNDRSMKNLAALNARKIVDNGCRFAEPGRESLYGFCRYINLLSSIDKILAEPVAEPLERDNYLPVLQVLVSRSSGGTTDGWMIAAKGGHNEESHNHNDVGNFIVYDDGKPLIIDIGPEIYKANTFTDRRYEVWTTQSGYHNVPVINGVEQKNGRTFQAKDANSSITNKKALFSLDLSAAYPENAGVNYWKRTITLNRAQKVSVEENYSLQEIKGPTSIHFMVACPARVADKGVIVLNREDRNYELKFDPLRLKAEVEEIEISDPNLNKAWGNKLFRIKLNLINPEITGKLKYDIQRAI